MSIKRRAFNGYLLGGLVAGSGLGFVAGRYSNVCEMAIAQPALQSLQEAARLAPGIHLIGLAIDDFEPFNLAVAERKLLSVMGFDAGQVVPQGEFQAALTRAVRKDYALGNVVQVEQYLLSQSEALFVRYALEKQGLVGATYMAPTPEIVDGHIASDVKFGPSYTVVGKIFNEQPDGHGGLWVQAKNTPPGTVILVNNQRIKTRRKPEVLTGAVYGEDLQALIAQSAKHTIALFVPDTGIRQVLGEIEVRPRPPAAMMEDGRPSTVFCEVDEWSVRKEKNGEEIVVETLCGPRSSTIYLGELALKTRVKQRTIEAFLDRSLLRPEEYPLRLVDVQSGEAIHLGQLQP